MRVGEAESARLFDLTYGFAAHDAVGSEAKYDGHPGASSATTLRNLAQSSSQSGGPAMASNG
jgi:hypothetical protein